ncbi:hypothetical protein EJB05_30683, partial [Eragrostis curvula]
MSNSELEEGLFSGEVRVLQGRPGQHTSSTCIRSSKYNPRGLGFDGSVWNPIQWRILVFGDWSALPVDVLASVLVLLEIPDIFSSGAICRSWNKAYLAVRRRGHFSRGQQSPCLLYFSIDHGPE